MYLPQSLYYGASGGSSYFTSSLSSFYSPHRLIFNFLPPWSPSSSISLFCRGVRCTSDRHRTDIDTVSELQPPPPGSTLAVSLPENCISKDDGYDDAPLRWIKLSKNFSSYFIHIFCSFLHADTVVSDNGNWLFSIFLFLQLSLFLKYEFYIPIYIYYFII